VYVGRAARKATLNEKNSKIAPRDGSSHVPGHRSLTLADILVRLFDDSEDKN
jgi:hypothetical protein